MFVYRRPFRRPPRRFPVEAIQVTTIAGTATQSLPAFTQSASSIQEGTGVGAQTLPGFTQSLLSLQTGQGVATQSLPGLSQVMSGTVSGSASITQTLPSITQTAEEGADSFYTLPPFEVTATMVATVDSDDVVMNLPSMTQGAFGALAGGSGFGVQNLPSLGMVLVGTVSQSGAATQSLPSLSQAMFAQQNFFIEQTLPSMSQLGFQPVDCWVSGVATIADTVSATVEFQDGVMSKQAELCGV